MKNDFVFIVWFHTLPCLLFFSAVDPDQALLIIKQKWKIKKKAKTQFKENLLLLESNGIITCRLQHNFLDFSDKFKRVFVFNFLFRIVESHVYNLKHELSFNTNFYETS